MAQQPGELLNIAEVHVIEHLGDTGGCMMREVAEFLVVAVNTVTAIVDKLEEKQLKSAASGTTTTAASSGPISPRKGRSAYKAILEMRICRLAGRC